MANVVIFVANPLYVEPILKELTESSAEKIVSYARGRVEFVSGDRLYVMTPDNLHIKLRGLTIDQLLVSIDIDPCVQQETVTAAAPQLSPSAEVIYF